MDVLRFFGFIAIVMVGGMFMAFVLEFLNTEDRGELKARKRSVKVEPVFQSVATLPTFFATLRTHERPLADPKLDEVLIAFLENHVKAEQAMVSKFVHLPSVDSLYRRAQSPQTMN